MKVEFRKKGSDLRMQASAGETDEQNPRETEADVNAASESSAGIADKDLQETIARLTAEKQELKETMVRRQADFENYRKRVERDRAEDRSRGIAALAEAMLPVLDAFDRALASDSNPAHAEYQKGFVGIRKLLWSALEKQGLQKIEAAGTEFDPNVHHAIERVHTDKFPDGTVIEDVQTGYMLNGRVLRPAMVRVAAEVDKTVN